MSNERQNSPVRVIVLLAFMHLVLFVAALWVLFALTSALDLAVFIIITTQLALVVIWIVLGTGMLRSRMCVLCLLPAIFLLSGIYGVVLLMLFLYLAMIFGFVKSVIKVSIGPVEEPPLVPLRWSIRDWLMLTAVLAAVLSLAAALPAEVNWALFLLALAVGSIWAPLVSGRPALYSLALLPGGAIVGGSAAWLRDPDQVWFAVAVPFCFLPSLATLLAVRMTGHKLTRETPDTSQEEYENETQADLWRDAPR